MRQYGEDLRRLRAVPSQELDIAAQQRKFALDMMDGVKRNVNWLRVYEELKILQLGILGVRNRVRVWKAVEEVVKRIEHLRDTQPADRYISRHEGGRGVEPTVEEKEGLIKRCFSC